jgi:hypothetical protein
MEVPAASLRVLAGWADALAAGFPPGRWQGGDADAAGVITMPWYERSDELARFASDMAGAGLVRPVGWMAWAATPEAQRFIGDPTAIAEAGPDDIVFLVTTIIRGERFSDGQIAGAYERGTLLALARRARALLGEPSSG